MGPGRQCPAVFACCVLYMLSSCNCDNLKIAAFNIQVFGKAKMSNTGVVDILVDIISEFDLVLVQEIRDSSGEAIVELLSKVNEKNEFKEYNMTISPRLGRSTSKEQYAYLYRPSSGLSVVWDYVYDDGNETAGTDIFEREPHVVLFQSSNTKLKKFASIGIHVAPGDAVAEIQAFYDVFDDVRNKMATDDIMLMGDLNADCSYVPKSKWSEIPMKTDDSYTWLITDSMDTTVSNTDCAYDRFIMTGTGFVNKYVNGSANVFKYDEKYGLNQTFALDVSDHYPIWFEIQGDNSSTSGSVSFMFCVTTIWLVFCLQYLLI